MRPVTDRIPKTLVPILGRPFASYQLHWLAEQGVRRVVYCIGYRGDLVRNYVGDGSAWGVAATYVDEGPDLMGTAGALRLALDAGALPDRFFVLYGDAYLPVALARIWIAFERSGRPALMTVFRNDGRWDRSNVVFHNGVVELYQKSVPTAWGDMVFIDYGISVLQREVVERFVAPGVATDLADIFHRLSVEGLLGGHEVTERFYEIGSPAGIRQLEEYLLSTKLSGTHPRTVRES